MACRVRSFARGETLLHEGTAADGMYVVLSGVVKVVRFGSDGKETILHLVRNGNTLGEAAVFQQGTFPASALAVDQVSALHVPAEILICLVRENPDLALRMLAALSLRLRMFSHKLAAQGQVDAARRLALYLLHRSQLDGGNPRDSSGRFPGSAGESSGTGSGNPVAPAFAFRRAGGRRAERTGDHDSRPGGTAPSGGRRDFTHLRLAGP